MLKDLPRAAFEAPIEPPKDEQQIACFAFRHGCLATRRLKKRKQRRPPRSTAALFLGALRTSEARLRPSIPDARLRRAPEDEVGVFCGEITDPHGEEPAAKADVWNHADRVRSGVRNCPGRNRERDGAPEMQPPDRLKVTRFS